MAGKRFGRLLVLDRSPISKAKIAYWYCKCDCGTKKDVNGQHLRSGRVVSCGCYGQGVARTHGKSRTRTYRCWNGMLERCKVSASHITRNHGNRGIRVCSRWRKFENFFADMGECPSGHTLDRINNNGNYEPGNCRWATPLEQMQNTRTNHNITLQGRTLSMSAWARERGLLLGTLIGRLQRGWPVEMALLVPATKSNRSRAFKEKAFKRQFLP